MHDALAASGASEEEIAQVFSSATPSLAWHCKTVLQSMLEAMAASGASADIIAKTMQVAGHRTEMQDV
jgi:alkylhydroperoxidase/carboxymuconolactone decarboxylase family protein YurZ